MSETIEKRQKKSGKEVMMALSLSKLPVRNQFLKKSGMALVVVLGFATALLIFCSSYIDQARKKTIFNPKLLTTIQANFLGQGIAEVAALKVKKLPGPLYYAAIASNSIKYLVPYINYIGDTAINPKITTPFNGSCSTQITMFASQMYKQMNFKIDVKVDISYLFGTQLVTDQRIITLILNGTRRLSS
ncbi:MAG: hypothetical protein HQM08_07365 [Candidatus Riflebacteria bacterium]|nr:hypothetical protein [Candidatus Riflebacteria bacterium]